MNNQDYRNVLLDAFFESNKLAVEQIDSYNSFIDKLQDYVDEVKLINPKISDVTIELGEVKIGRPQVVEADGLHKKMLPFEARLRGRTYAAPLWIKMSLLRRGIPSETENIYVGDMPVLAKSKLCYLSEMTPDQLVQGKEDPLDPGGYFITNGTERIVGNREETAIGKLLVKEAGLTTSGTYMGQRGAFKARVSVEKDKGSVLRVAFPTVRKIKLINVLIALGMTKDQIAKEFKGTLEVENDLLVNFEECDVKNEEEGLLYIGKFVAPNQPNEYKLRRSNEVLDQFLLPNIGVTRDDRHLKAYALIRMAEKIIDSSYGLRPTDDLDNYANKRVRTTGPMMEQLFRQALKKMAMDIQKNIEKTIARRRKLRLKTLIQPAVLTQTIQRSVNTGIWNTQTKGITRVLDRTNYVSVAIDFKKINSGLSPLRAPLDSRKLHGTHWGRICCVSTPDDENCGLTKNLSTLSQITIDSSPEQVIDVLQKSKIKIVR